ncbi:MAG TPA: energy-coupling factor transporter transmembrane protein EcfT [Candidatus Cloacimonetes bacterium]|nr:energy-coupling factor transporter transmembrane protein EcfT [Candidatus Cloacimonadota bacterium]HEX37805.1 energy-coupling factor transporter transmembrane protein EcfT [Candidatus Cloacimonadota bacterium]
MNPRTLLVLSLLISTLSVILPEVEQLLVLLGISIFFIFVLQPSKERFSLLWKRLKILIIIIVILFIMQLLFRHDGNILFHWKWITVYTEGFFIALQVSLRLLILFLVVSLLFDIPYYDFLLALRSWKLPYEFSLMVASTFYFVRAFEDQFRFTKELLIIREISFKKIPLFNKFQAFSTVLFPVIARTLQTIKYRAISLDIRGFRLYSQRTEFISHKLKWFDYVIQITCVLLFLLVMYFLISNK